MPLNQSSSYSLSNHCILYAPPALSSKASDASSSKLHVTKETKVPGGLGPSISSLSNPLLHQLAEARVAQQQIHALHYLSITTGKPEFLRTAHVLTASRVNPDHAYARILRMGSGGGGRKGPADASRIRSRHPPSSFSHPYRSTSVPRAKSLAAAPHAPSPPTLRRSSGVRSNRTVSAATPLHRPLLPQSSPSGGMVRSPPSTSSSSASSMTTGRQPGSPPGLSGMIGLRLQCVRCRLSLSSAPALARHYLAQQSCLEIFLRLQLERYADSSQDSAGIVRARMASLRIAAQSAPSQWNLLCSLFSNSSSPPTSPSIIPPSPGHVQPSTYPTPPPTTPISPSISTVSPSALACPPRGLEGRWVQQSPPKPPSHPFYHPHRQDY
ncbi:MAG: hypothetical protein DHS80DRAFT_24242 [Piptocephalis tieghemiana]|nr:MAG: hypothetical protein DHS80DRAFT_24242 [Piptocephalis tieghemiana]